MREDPNHRTRDEDADAAMRGSLAIALNAMTLIWELPPSNASLGEGLAALLFTPKRASA